MTKDFEINTFSLTIPLKFQESVLDRIASQFSEARLKLKTFTSINIEFKRLRDLLPEITFRNEDRTASIDLSSKKLELMIGSNAYFVDIDEKRKSKEIFRKEHLLEIQSQFNYILALILGQTQPAENPRVEGNIYLLSREFKYNFDYLMDKMELNGSNTHLTGLQLQRTEDLWGTSVSIEYRYMQTNEGAQGRIGFSFKQSYPLDFPTMIDTSIGQFHETFRGFHK
jgi:hypothetical protein